MFEISTNQVLNRLKHRGIKWDLFPCVEQPALVNHPHLKAIAP